MLSRLFLSALAAALVSVAAISSAADAQEPQARIGVLECSGGPSAGYIIGSTTNLDCMLTRNGRRAEPYVAQICRYGFDIGVTERWAMAWEVFGPSPRLAPGGLSGTYGGAGASASVGTGAAANQLVGGPNGAVSLIPLDAAGQQGLNLAFGFEGMEIRPARF
ncbi:MAG: DUF992 domain-containing protein [Xanthobacteraceae bacterium]